MMGARQTTKGALGYTKGASFPFRTMPLISSPVRPVIPFRMTKDFPSKRIANQPTRGRLHDSEFARLQFR